MGGGATDPTAATAARWGPFFHGGVPGKDVGELLGPALITWPSTGHAPQQLTEVLTASRSRRRGGALPFSHGLLVVGRRLGAMSGSGERDGGGWTDLARNAPGIGVSYEAARRRQAKGLGADRSWRVGADGEVAIAQVLAELVEPSRWDRLRGRCAAWRVLHSVPLGDGRGGVRGDVDHVLIGPPGVVTINTKHHRAGRLVLDGDALVVNGHPTEYVRKARREAERVVGFLQPVLAAAGEPVLAARLTVRPMLAIVGGRLLITRWAQGVTVVMPRQLVAALRAIPPVLDAVEVAAVFEVARRAAAQRADVIVAEPGRPCRVGGAPRQAPVGPAP